MTRKITYAWIKNCGNERLALAQEKLADSIRSHGLEPDLYVVGPELFKFADLLRYARERSECDGFVWCNSDVILRRNPYELRSREKVHGFLRTEIPSGSLTHGVDMYLIPNQVWDSCLSRDVPDLYCGTSFVDWWITRSAQLAGIYEVHAGYIDHVTHPRSAAALSASDRYYLHNQKEYNLWARRNGAGLYEPLILPGFWKKLERCRTAFRSWVS